jgi:hypothetical protein
MHAPAPSPDSAASIPEASGMDSTPPVAGRPVVRRAVLQVASLMMLAGGEAIAGSPRRRRRSGDGSSVSSDTVIVRVFNGTYSSNTNSITAGSNAIQVAVAGGTALPTDFFTVERGQVQQFEVKAGPVQVSVSAEADPDEASLTARTYYLADRQGGTTTYVLADYRTETDDDDNTIDIYTVKVAPKGVTF